MTMTNGQAPGLLSKISHRLLQLEEGLLLSLAVLMIGLAVTQIFLRNFLDTGLNWADGFVRVLVLWIGLFGAMVAARSQRHITIDVISRHLPGRLKPAGSFLTTAFSAGVCALVAWHSGKFVWLEYQYGGTAFAEVPAWVCEAVIPFGFAVIGLRFLAQAAIHLRGVFGSGR